MSSLDPWATPGTRQELFSIHKQMKRFITTPCSIASFLRKANVRTDTKLRMVLTSQFKTRLCLALWIRSQKWRILNNSILRRFRSQRGQQGQHCWTPSENQLTKSRTRKFSALKRIKLNSRTRMLCYLWCQTTTWLVSKNKFTIK